MRAKTRRRYESISRVHIKPFLGEYALDHIRPATIAALLRLREQDPERPASPRMIELVVVILRAALETAVGGTIATNPVQRSHRPRVPRRSMVV